MQKHEKAAYFCIHLFPLYDSMATLLDGFILTGTYAFSIEFGLQEDGPAIDGKFHRDGFVIDSTLCETQELVTDNENENRKVSDLDNVMF